MINPIHLSELLVVPYARQAGYAVRKPWKSGIRRLLDYLLVYVQEGTFTLTYDGQEMQIPENEFCLIQPGTLFTMEGKTSTITPFVHLDFFYHPRRADSFATKPGQTDLTEFIHLLQPSMNAIEKMNVPVHFHPAQPLIFRDTLFKIIDLFERQEPYFELQIQHLATGLFLDLTQRYMDWEKQTYHSPETLNWVTSYLQFNLHLPITLQDMAHRAMLSPSRFIAVFKNKFGISPHQYLIRLRIQHAKDLLKNEKFTISEIAEYCGFSNIHHFSREFKRNTSFTPLEFRKQIFKP